MKRMNAMMLSTMMILALGAAGAAAEMHGQDVHKMSAKVVMMTGTVLNVADKSGTIEDLKITSDSKMGPGISEGDWIDIWYREDQEGGKVVVSSAASSQTSSASSSQTTASEKQPMEPGKGTETTGSMNAEKGASAGAAMAGGADDPLADSDAPSYDEVVGAPEKVMTRRPSRGMLPQTATQLPAIGILGLVFMTAALLLSVSKLRS